MKVQKILTVLFATLLSKVTFCQEESPPIKDIFIQGKECENSCDDVDKTKISKIFEPFSGVKYSRTSYLRFVIPKKTERMAKVELSLIKVFKAIKSATYNKSKEERKGYVLDVNKLRALT